MFVSRRYKSQIANPKAKCRTLQSGPNRQASTVTNRTDWLTDCTKLQFVMTLSNGVKVRNQCIYNHKKLGDEMFFEHISLQNKTAFEMHFFFSK